MRISRRRDLSLPVFDQNSLGKVVGTIDGVPFILMRITRSISDFEIQLGIMSKPVAEALYTIPETEFGVPK